MKLKKGFFSIIVLMTLGFAIYFWFNQEKKQNGKKCSECEQIENGKLERRIGTIKILPESKMFFTEKETGTKFYLIPCDANCSNFLNQWFKKMGVIDFSTQKPYYFDIEGKLDVQKKQFILLNVVLLGEDSA